MVFSDLMKRFFTAITLIVLGSAWLLGSRHIPGLFMLGMVTLAGLCLYEWWSISRHQGFLFKMAGALTIVLGFSAWSYVHHLFGVWATMLVLSTAVISDTAAYFGGRFFQGPKLCPAISPSKTWSGSLTSLAIAPFVPILTMKVMFSTSISVIWSYWTWSAWGFLVLFVAIGQLGDLIESAAKRACKVKDSGKWLPGHGGFLDRLDSILIMFIACAAYFWYFLDV